MTTRKSVLREVGVRVKEGPIEDMQRSLAETGESINEHEHMMNEAEMKAMYALTSEGIQLISHHHVGGYEFDFKVKGFPVLIEIDGAIHDMYAKRVKDLRKDRMATARGFRVLRFTTEEPASVIVADVKSVIGGLPKQPREVWLVKYTWWMRFKEWVKSW